MAYVKITNGTIDTYPYSVGQLRRDNPQTSFPKRIPDEMLAAWGVYPVTFTEAPSIDERTQKIQQDAAPSSVNGAWLVGWTTASKTAEEVKEYDDNAAAQVRAERNALLAESDWTQIADAPVDAAVWATYRQALRDITSHANFPHLDEADWPVKP
jgi:hypothetical protein